MTSIVHHDERCDEWKRAITRSNEHQEIIRCHSRGQRESQNDRVKNIKTRGPVIGPRVVFCNRSFIYIPASF
ncbi:hypothetical protein [Coprobacter tertius]|uniref:Uncharacterized protein n=1 Tax=Coprobacter tertius TaxID=2944915 RepID=A0ABT1MM15_9BACT|nr:hypothetical protein [Coprobacter tertius]MCP9612941.1 hypothetical protein [Coprobacter tertius]